MNAPLDNSDVFDSSELTWTSKFASLFSLAGENLHTDWCVVFSPIESVLLD